MKNYLPSKIEYIIAKNSSALLSQNNANVIAKLFWHNSPVILVRAEFYPTKRYLHGLLIEQNIKVITQIVFEFFWQLKDESSDIYLALERPNLGVLEDEHSIQNKARPVKFTYNNMEQEVLLLRIHTQEELRAYLTPLFGLSETYALVFFSEESENHRADVYTQESFLKGISYVARDVDGEILQILLPKGNIDKALSSLELVAHNKNIEVGEFAGDLYEFL